VKSLVAIMYVFPFIFYPTQCTNCRFQWPRCLRRRSTAVRLLRSWVRIPPGGWMFVCRECCVLSGRGLCDELITSPEESYRLWCVVVCDLETSWMRKPWPTGGCLAKKKCTNWNKIKWKKKEYRTKYQLLHVSAPMCHRQGLY